jgi:hypothetical protein
MLAALTEDANLAALVEGELIDQVKYFPKAEYAFHHPLIRTVAYESQLRSDRARLHRKLAETIEATGSADENAALIAEHLEAAGDLHAAFAWHMRCGAWAINRDFAAAHTAWRKHAKSPTDSLKATPNGCRCGSRHEPTCVPLRPVKAAVVPTRASPNCVICATQQEITAR